MTKDIFMRFEPQYMNEIHECEFNLGSLLGERNKNKILLRKSYLVKKNMHGLLNDSG